MVQFAIHIIYSCDRGKTCLKPSSFLPLIKKLRSFLLLPPLLSPKILWLHDNFLYMLLLIAFLFFKVPCCSIVALLERCTFRINLSYLNSPGRECILHIKMTNMISEMALVVVSFTNVNIVFCANFFHVLTQFEMYFGVKYAKKGIYWKVQISIYLKLGSEHFICMYIFLQDTPKMEMSNHYMNKSKIKYGCLLDLILT